MNDETRETRALDRFLDELVQDPDTPAPLTGELDLETIACARRLVAAEQGEEQDDKDEAVKARVWQRVMAAQRNGPAVQPRSLGWKLNRPLPSSWIRVGLATAGLFLAVAIGLYVWASQAPTVSAQEIIQKAQATANSPAAGGVSSFVLAETQQTLSTNPRIGASAGLQPGDNVQASTKRWYQAPNRWRSEYEQSIVGADGKQKSSYRNVQVSDGMDLWQFEPAQNTVIVNQLDPSMNGKQAMSLFGEDVANLTDLFQQASTCFDPKVTGSATIAGRDTYVIDMGLSKCPSASVSEMNGRLVIWVDKKTFFILKQEQHSTDGDKVVLTRQVTSIQYNGAVDPSEFTFTPPAGAKVTDNRPKPAPSSDQFKQQLEQIAKQAEFPVLAPSYLPAGLAPQQPKIDPMMDNSIEISYFPTDEPDKDSMASLMKGLAIREVRASNSLVARWTDRADPISIGDNKGWLRRGVRNADNTGSDSAALVLRDGVLISVSSFTIAPEELVKVATSLQPVPGSRTSLPNPVPPTLAELRSKVTFPIFVPTFVPVGLTPEQPTGGELPGENVTIKYHDASGAVALTVLNGTLDCCPGLDMMQSEPIKLPNGMSAKTSNMGPNAGGLYLWFEQEKRLISLNSPVLSKDQMLQVAASMSKTADLGKTTEPPVRPTPTPLAPLKYTVLRPTWLPESMAVHEQRDGDIMTLGFDPRPNDAPHGVLTLVEKLKAMISPGGSPDPQESHETIGGHDVTIIKRGQNCITLTWEVGDLNLVLTNPYDPPGHPRYSCDQLRKIVESVR